MTSISFPYLSATKFSTIKYMKFKQILALIILSITTSTVFCQEITVENIWKQYAFFGKRVDGFKSMKDGNYFTKISKIEGNPCIAKYKFSSYNSQPEILVNLTELVHNGKNLSIDDYFFNSDETKILFTTNTQSIYRRSFLAEYFLYDISSKNLEPLSTEHSPQQLAEYSPDGKKVSFIFQNNLYIKDIGSQEIQQVTSDGKTNEIINGTTDWVYEEEFAITKGYEWSFDSQFISFMKFDESKVKEFTLSYHGELYPEEYKYKYPKAGEDNSKVELFLYSTGDNSTSRIELGDYEYIPRFKWSTSKNRLVILTLNRHQNDLKYHAVSVQKEKGISSSVFYQEKDDAYVEIDDNLLFLNNDQGILRTSEIDGFNHIYKLDFNGQQTQITKGDWDVIELKGIDNSNKYIYYTSAENGAIYKSIFKIDISGKNKKLLSAKKGTSDGEFSNGMNYFVKSYSDANTPTSYTLCSNKGTEMNVLEDNSALNKRIKQFNFSRKEFTTFKGVTEELNGWIIKPANFDPTKKYPVYINIYGGPGSNMVSDSWGSANLAYHQLLAQQGYIVVSVDPRGTMYRGAKFKKSTYLQLGKLELEDFIAVAEELGQMNYVDKDRIGIMGWSYGGFMTSLCMTKGKGLFKMGIAVAPVTNWKYYDNIYTERFMRTPKENETGYNDNSPINFTKDLKGNYFIIHGTTDDNVHYQNALDMISSLVEANKSFDMFIYPNKNHGIYGGNTRNHLFTMMLNYTLENL